MSVNNNFHDQYDLFWQGLLIDPYPLYHQLRSYDPVHWCEPLNTWIITRYSDVNFVIQHDPRLTSERVNPLIDILPPSVQTEMQPLREHLSAWMQNYEPPEHTRLRSLVSKAFTPHMLDAHRTRIQEIVDDLIDSVKINSKKNLRTIRNGSTSEVHIDVIRDFASPLPVTLITEMLGVPELDRTPFQKWTIDIAGFLAGYPSNLEDVARRAQRSVLELNEYLRDIFSQRRKHPEEDLISALVSVDDAGKKLSEVELFGMCVFLLVAGHHTTTGMISNGLLALLRHPDQFQKLKNSPGLISTAVDEFLRYDSPLQFLSRYSTQDFHLGDKLIHQGQKIWAMLGAANRDPEYFTDPDRLNVERKKNRHLAFGFGIHFCLGASLARMEGDIAFSTLLRRLPGLKLTEVSPERAVSINRPLKCLNVTFNMKNDT